MTINSVQRILNVYRHYFSSLFNSKFVSGVDRANVKFCSLIKSEMTVSFFIWTYMRYIQKIWISLLVEWYTWNRRLHYVFSRHVFCWLSFNVSRYSMRFIYQSVHKLLLSIKPNLKRRRFLTKYNARESTRGIDERSTLNRWKMIVIALNSSSHCTLAGMF